MSSEYMNDLSLNNGPGTKSVSLVVSVTSLLSYESSNKSDKISAGDYRLREANDHLGTHVSYLYNYLRRVDRSDYNMHISYMPISC